MARSDTTVSVSIPPSSSRRWVYAVLGALVVPPTWLGITIGIQGLFGANGTAAMIASGTLVLAVTSAFVGYALGRSADDLVVTSLQDPLTRIGNRRHYENRVTREIERALAADAPLSLLLLDLDFLKRINDSKGHAAGDMAVRAVADAITRSCRCRDFGARIGGDEFAVILPRTRSHEAAILAERIRRTLRSQGATSGAEGNKLTVSIGIAELHGIENPTAESLFEAADAALYDAKMSGRDRARVSDPRAEGVVAWVPCVSGVVSVGRVGCETEAEDEAEARDSRPATAGT